MYGQFFLLFAMIITGYILRKLRFVDEGMNDGLNKFIVYFAFPCLLVQKMSRLNMDGATRDFAIMFLLSCGLFVVYSLFAYIYAKMRKFPRRVANVAEISMIAPNNGFMGIPISLIFFGDKGMFLMMAHNITLNLFFFTYTLGALRRNNENKKTWSVKEAGLVVFRLLINPNIVAIILGLFMAYNKIPLDNVAGQYLDMMGNVATPMAMIYIGSSLAGSSFFDMFKNHMIWESAIIKDVAFPIITLGIVYFLPIDSAIKAMLVLGAAFPTGASVAMLAQQEKQNADLASKILFFSTMWSMATIPIIVKLIHVSVT